MNHSRYKYITNSIYMQYLLAVCTCNSHVESQFMVLKSLAIAPFFQYVNCCKHILVVVVDFVVVFELLELLKVYTCKVLKKVFYKSHLIIDETATSKVQGQQDYYMCVTNLAPQSIYCAGSFAVTSLAPFPHFHTITTRIFARMLLKFLFRSFFIAGFPILFPTAFILCI